MVKVTMVIAMNIDRRHWIEKLHWLMILTNVAMTTGHSCHDEKQLLKMAGNTDTKMEIHRTKNSKQLKII